MIIFYEKKTGKIIGTIQGRVHSKEHLNMWIGDKSETGRLVVNWKPGKKSKDKKGNVVFADYQPDCDDDLKPIIVKNEKNFSYFRKNHLFDVKTKKIRLKTKAEKKVVTTKNAPNQKSASTKRVEELRTIIKKQKDTKK